MALATAASTKTVVCWDAGKPLLASFLMLLGLDEIEAGDMQNLDVAVTAALFSNIALRLTLTRLLQLDYSTYISVSYYFYTTTRALQVASPVETRADSTQRHHSRSRQPRPPEANRGRKARSPTVLLQNLHLQHNAADNPSSQPSDAALPLRLPPSSGADLARGSLPRVRGLSSLAS